MLYLLQRSLVKKLLYQLFYNESMDEDRYPAFLFFISLLVLATAESDFYIHLTKLLSLEK
jgi:hypothetical protein